MKQSFDQIGKRMPYTVPQNFFEEMEANVWEEIQGKTAVSRPVRKRWWLRAAIGATAVAASVAWAFVLAPARPGTHEVGMAQVEQIFSNLSSEDQAYMLEVYQEDLFINE